VDARWSPSKLKPSLWTRCVYDEGVFTQSDIYILAKIVLHDIWKCRTTKIGLIVSVKIVSYDAICWIE
jgi:hypothetical protein